MRAYQVNSKQPSDFRIFYEASVDAQQGANPYRTTSSHLPYIYSPLLIWCVTPLTRLPLLAAVEVWTILSFIAWVVLVYGAGRLTGWTGSWPTGVLVVPSLICYRFVLRLNLHGQVDLILWAIVVCGILCLAAKRDVVSGVLLALAFVLKPLPVLFLLVLPLKRRYAACAAAGVAVAFFLVLPMISYGPTRYLELMRQWRDGRILTDLTDVTFEAESSNQSIQAALVRYLGERERTPKEYWPAAIGRLPASTINVIYLIVSMLIVLSLLPAISRSCDPGFQLAVEVALLVCATHLISRRTLEYHLVSLIVPFTVGIAMSTAAEAGDEGVRRLRSGLAVSAFLLNFYTPMLIGNRISQVIQSYGPATVALLVLFAVTRSAATARRGVLYELRARSDSSS